jgi:hypothetical protein
MKPRSLFVVGAPGVGKTTSVRTLLDSVDPLHLRFMTRNPKWTVVRGKIACAGHYTGAKFDGADTVPYNGARALVESIPRVSAEFAPRVLVFDGDRFSDLGSRTEIQARTSGIHVAMICAPDDQTSERRLRRGSDQNPSWVRGRETKARRFFSMPGWDSAREILSLDGAVPDLASEVLSEILGEDI